MQSRTIRFAAAVVTLAALAVFSVTFAHAFFISPDSDIEIPPMGTFRGTSSQASSSALPDRLLIPAIGVDAHVQHVGLGKTGNMAVPTNYTDVGWYRGGTVPGEVGSAVVDGHVDNGLGFAAVFKRLNEVVPGDDIYIVTGGGKRLHFRVSEVESYAVNEVPREKVFLSADAAHLNLITCEGTWIPSKKMYDGRLVVYATLVNG